MFQKFTVLKSWQGKTDLIVSQSKPLGRKVRQQKG